MNERQKAFADEYIISLNATDAARKAGYKQKYIDTNASKLLENTRIKIYIQERLKEKANSRIASAEEVLETITEILRDPMNKATDRLKASELLGKRYALYIDKVESENVNTNNNYDLSKMTDEQIDKILNN